MCNCGELCYEATVRSTQIKKSILSGILIGIGNAIYMTLDNHYIGAALFSFALLAIMSNGLPLYTGQIGFIDRYRKTDLIEVLLGNLIGVGIVMSLIIWCNDDLYQAMLVNAEMKFSESILSHFVLGILCGILMFVAVHSKRTVITVMCIMIFILSGYRHCIADFSYYALLSFNVTNLIKFLCVILGNSVGSIVAYRLVGGNYENRK